MSTAQLIQSQATTDLLNKTGAFFAFSQAQLDESKKEGVEYVRLSMGLIIPKKNVEEYIKTSQKISTDFLEQDIKENGKDGIIERELRNYECFYVMDISDALPVLKDYGFTEAEVMAVFMNLKNNEEF